MFTLGELAKRLDAKVHGDADCVIRSVANVDKAGEGDIVFLADSKYRQAISRTRASAVILRENDLGDLHTNGLLVENPRYAYAQVTAWLYPEPAVSAGIHPSATVDPGSNIHKSASIGAQCVIEAGVEIAEGCIIGPACVISADSHIGKGSRLVASVTICRDTRIGKNAVIHPGVVLGADGFGLANFDGQWRKIPQIGRVILGDDVEIGANTTIDCGAIDDTVIGNGVKLDNLIQVGHNVHIGDHTAIAACTAIAGSTHIGKHCTIGGCVGIVGHLEIADNVYITGMSHVSQSITGPGSYSSGTPLEENAKWHRNFIRMKQLDDMAKRLKKLEKKQQEN